MSTNQEKFTQAFVDGLRIHEEKIVDSLEYNSIPEWDSIAHMAVIASLEDAFDIMLDTDDIIDMSSVAKAKEILLKYDVTI